MRLACLLAALALLHAPSALAQWEKQSALPTFLDVRGVAAPAPQHVVLVTAADAADPGGSLFESLDGGATWSRRALAGELNGVTFVDAQHGWAYGNANHRTTDGGATWTPLPFLGSTYGMEFENASFGHASGNFGWAISRDGGLTWSPSPGDQFEFAFADAQLGVGIASSGIFRTADGGATFASVLAGNARAVVFPAPNLAVAIVDDTVMRSTDGGLTWTPGAGAQGRSGLTALSPAVLLAWGRSGAYPDFDDRVLRSADGGLTWSDLGEVLQSDATAAGFAFTVVDAQTVVASNGRGELVRSADAGLTWTRVLASRGPRPSYFHHGGAVFAGTQAGYFAFGPGFVVATQDGGATWSQVSGGIGLSLADADRFPDGRRIAVGESGAVLTSTGSSPWVLGEAFTSAAVAAVDVVGPQQVVVVDRTGRVYRSADGGVTWTGGASAPAGLEAADLRFSSLLDGWVTGSGFAGGALFHTGDGGDSWTAAPGIAGTYVAVDFEGAHGWAANVSGVIQRTADHGASWTATVLPGALWIRDVEFFDETTGYVAGHYGYAARSADGGATWQVLPVPDGGVNFSDIEVLGPNTLWLSTTRGVAWYSATGGQSWSVLPTGGGSLGGFAAITAVPGGDAWAVGYRGEIRRFTGPPPGPANQSPSASFTFVTTGLSVQFTDTSTDPDGAIVERSWDFGDGTGSTETDPVHAYAAANTWIVRLTVTDEGGARDSAVRFIVVQPGPGGTFGEFTEVTPTAPPFVTPQDEDFWVITTAAADHDGDGDLDVAILGYDVVYNTSVVHRLLLMRNDGPTAGTAWGFVPVEVPLGELSAGASDLAWGDPDGDGDPDLVVGSDGATVIYRNDLGTLVLTDTVLPGYAEDNDQADFDLRSITWADWDNDGDADLLVPSVFDDATFAWRTSLLRNDGPNGTGGWTFSANDSALAPTSHAQSAWADFDGDQDLDLLLVGLAPLSDEGFIRRYRNDGGGTFTGEDILGTLSIEHGEAQWGDYDADGDLDVLVAGNLRETDDSYTTALRIYRNDAGTWNAIEVIDCVPCEGWFDLTAATWADYDSDGDVDILLAGTWNSGSQIEGRARVYDNVGGAFVDSGNELPAPRASGSRGGTFTWLDLDGDGDLDYYIAGQYFVPGGNGLVEAQMHAYRNGAPGVNAAPSAPAGLGAAVNPSTGTVLLSWSPASDDLTPATALTYDLALVRGGAAATPRYAPAPGSLGTAGAWALAGLPSGDYTWTLRAVDSAYNGSAAATGTFRVGAPVDVVPPPDRFAFGGSFPNPFSGSTTFRFSLPARSQVSLEVFDASGRRVAQPLDGTRDAGVHDVRWHAGEVPAGLLFARLTVDGFTRTQRIVHLR